MIGNSERIINNIISTNEYERKINIDYATITNLDNNEISELVLESTGASLNGSFRLFSDYVFFIQNNLIQHSSLCISMNNLVINSNHVRIENNGVITHALIENNVLIELTEEEVIANGFDRNVLENNRAQAVNNNFSANVNYINISSLSKDTQNVHNSFIVSKLCYIYFKILELIQRNTQLSHRSNISLDYCKNILLDKYRNKDSESKEKLNRVICFIIAQNGYIYNLKQTETQILINIVLYILNCVNAEMQNDIFMLLCDCLVDCLEYDTVVCLTGRVNRMINSVEYLVSVHLSKKEKYPSIKEAREEMLRIAMKLYNSGKEMKDIYFNIIEEFNHLDRADIVKEIDSWNLEYLF